MTANRNTKHTAASQNSLDAMTALFAMPGFAFSQKVALEAARFSAQRMRAYADQMEALAGCANPADLVTLNAQFLQQAQADYVAESQTMREIIAAAREEDAPLKASAH